MNKADYHHPLPPDEMAELIDRYFAAETTRDEEALLREALADGRWRGARVDEARFAMGYFALNGQDRRRSGQKSWRWAGLAAAAAVAALLAVAPRLFQGIDQTDRCVAWVGGEAVGDRGRVMSLIADDLDGMQCASSELHDGIQLRLD